eukprot:CAMPEP_0185558206 /NCGR_PEP_ID=MMETSP1381-20130426/51667_1 /TAXON_ID=298111 /ORGANISM="Pavlova sp., Strain CCMP459" /LENGTH=55 /DNA_ID=CAMNT_0028171729 /DNA_START=18 /DNA_END=182 /DNA_ORIENTATION=-
MDLKGYALMHKDREAYISNEIRTRVLNWQSLVQDLAFASTADMKNKLNRMEVNVL